MPLKERLECGGSKPTHPPALPNGGRNCEKKGRHPPPLKVDPEADSANARHSSLWSRPWPVWACIVPLWRPLRRCSGLACLRACCECRDGRSTGRCCWAAWPLQPPPSLRQPSLQIRAQVAERTGQVQQCESVERYISIFSQSGRSALPNVMGGSSPERNFGGSAKGHHRAGEMKNSYAKAAWLPRLSRALCKILQAARAQCGAAVRRVLQIL